MSNVEKVKRRLKRKAMAAAGEWEFETGCEGELDAFLDQGVSSLEEKQQLENEISILIAEKAIEMFVLSMVREATKLGLSKLSEITFRAVKESLCPLWPFC